MEKTPEIILPDLDRKCPICLVPARAEPALGRKKPHYSCPQCGYDMTPSSGVRTGVFIAIGFVLLLLAASFVTGSLVRFSSIASSPNSMF